MSFTPLLSPASPPKLPLGSPKPPVSPPKKKHSKRNLVAFFGALAVLVGIIVVVTSGGGSSGPSESLLETNLLTQVQSNASWGFGYPNVAYVDCSSAGLPYDPGGSYSISWKPGNDIICQGYDGNGFLIGDIGITVEQGTPSSKAIAIMSASPSLPGVQYRYTDDWVYEYNGYNQYCHCVEPDGDGG